MRREHLEKATFASLTATFLTLTLLMAVLPSAIAHSGDTMYAPPASVPVAIDGVWSAGEWADALQYTMMNSTGGNVGYIRAKFNATHLLVVIDSPWDITPATVWAFENAFVAIDTTHNDTGVPGYDDYLVHVSGMSAWQGNGTTWSPTWVPGFAGAQAGSAWGPPLQTSPNSGTPHRIDEMAIPLTHVGSPGATVGFYVLVDDDSTDPDGQGWQPATAYSEWPPNAGGSPGWPGMWGAAPCPAPSAWGDLVLSSPPPPPPPPPPPVGGKSVPIIITPTEPQQLAPLIGLVSLITLIAVSVAYVKHRKKKQT